jgi:hypothetical protein
MLVGEEKCWSVGLVARDAGRGLAA